MCTLIFIVQGGIVVQDFKNNLDYQEKLRQTAVIICIKASKVLPVVAVVSGASGYLHFPVSTSILSKVSGAALIGIGSPVGLVVGTVAGFFAGALTTAVAAGVITYGVTRDKDAAVGAGIGGAFLGAVGGVVLGTVAGAYCGYNWTQDYLHSLLAKQNDPQTSSMNIEFGNSATPYVREIQKIQEQLKAEKGLVLEVPNMPQISTPKLVA